MVLTLKSVLFLDLIYRLNAARTLILYKYVYIRNCNRYTTKPKQQYYFLTFHFIFIYIADTRALLGLDVSRLSALGSDFLAINSL